MEPDRVAELILEGFTAVGAAVSILITWRNYRHLRHLRHRVTHHRHDEENNG